MSLEALQGSLTSFHPAIHAARPHAGQVDSAANVRSLLAGLRDSRVAPLVRQGAGRVLASLCRAGARREPRPARLRRAHRRDRDQRRHGQPARPPRRARDRLERQLPRSAHRLRARQPRDCGRRAREHLGAACRADGQPEPVGRAAGVPHPRGRHQLGDDDPPVRLGRARLREQGARPPGERGLDPDERRPGGSRLDGERCRPEGAAGAGERRAVARDRAACRRAGGGVPRAARAGARGGAATRAHVRTLSERLREDRSLSADIERVAASIRDGSVIAAVEDACGDVLR